MAKKQSQIVCQHLERISRGVLEDYQHIIREYIRGRHGIYALYRKDQLYYVGLAGSLHQRLRAHLKDRHAKSWTHFSVYLTIDTGHVKELESLLLRIVNPKGNSVGGRFKRSENLQRRLRQDIKNEHRETLTTLVGGKPTPRKPRPTKAKPTKGKRVTLLDVASLPLKLKGTYQGKTYRATARRDGQIRYAKRLYQSPSAAANAVVKAKRDGWHFWHYERAPGDWIPIAELKK